MNVERVVLPEPFYSLVGGIEKGALTNFYGAPGVGKTNICILAALECIRKGGKVIYIDTEGGFSPERIRQVTTNYKNVFENLILIEPKTFEEQAVVIKNLENKDFDMVILDSSVALYRLKCAECEDPTRDALATNKELVVQLSVLSSIARKKKVPVIITSHTFKNRDTGEDQIIGGDSINYWSKSIIFIEKTSRMSERKATIVKHRSVPEGRSVKFEIINEGIKPAGFRIF